MDRFDFIPNHENLLMMTPRIWPLWGITTGDSYRSFPFRDRGPSISDIGHNSEKYPQKIQHQILIQSTPGSYRTPGNHSLQTMLL